MWCKMIGNKKGKKLNYKINGGGLVGVGRL